MAQDWLVTDAFQGKDRDTKQVTVKEFNGNQFHVYMVKVQNQPVEGWMQILRKPGNPVEKGMSLYGDIIKNQWGKAQFKRAQTPFGHQAPQRQSTTDDAKIKALEDRVTALEAKLDNLARFQGNVATDPGESAPDLTNLDY
jgi:hypothetical protein|nr:MAG TPA: Intermediate conductance calcium-activated potassium channel-helix bundle, copper, MEMBRANE PROTEIN [Caudoviricetes sp.]